MSLYFTQSKCWSPYNGPQGPDDLANPHTHHYLWLIYYYSLPFSCLSTSLHAILQTYQTCSCFSTIPLTVPFAWNILDLYIHLVISLTSSKASAQILPWPKVSKLYILCSVWYSHTLFILFIWKVLKTF